MFAAPAGARGIERTPLIFSSFKTDDRFVALNSPKTVLVIIVALVAAFISAKLLAQGTPLVTLPWGLLAFLTAFIARNKKEALALGGCFGFVASYSYLWFDDTSRLTLSSVAVLIPLIIIPALIGLLCGLVASWLGWVVRQRLAPVPLH